MDPLGKRWSLEDTSRKRGIYVGRKEDFCLNPTGTERKEGTDPGWSSSSGHQDGMGRELSVLLIDSP